MALDLKQLLRDSFPEEFLRGTVDVLYAAYRGAVTECRERYTVEVAHDVRGHVQRATFEQAWRELAAQTSDVSARVLRNPRGTSFFTEVRSGRVVLTASAVTSPGAVPRDARFRKNRAFGNQGVLIGENPAPSDDDEVFAVLLHGPAERFPGILSFAGMAVPSPDFDAYLGHLDLFEVCPDVVRKNTPEEIIEDMAWPKLRRIERRREEGA